MNIIDEWNQIVCLKNKIINLEQEIDERRKEIYKIENKIIEQYGRDNAIQVTDENVLVVMNSELVLLDLVK